MDIISRLTFGLGFDWTSFIWCMNYSFFAFKSTSLHCVAKAQVRLFYWTCSNSAYINMYIYGNMHRFKKIGTGNAMIHLHVTLDKNMGV